MSAIVQDYNFPAIPTAPTLTSNTTRQTATPPPSNLEELIARYASDNGIERPRSHTVSFHYNPLVEQHHFGRSHPMKPWRLQLTKQLILSYGLQYAMECHETRRATRQEMAEFHREDYLEFLELLTPDNMSTHTDTMPTYGFGDDCPVFDGLYAYCSLYTGATLSAARTLLASTSPKPPSTPHPLTPPSGSSSTSDIAINWSGGLHHAFKSNASGFCYINDIVLAIQLLLTRHPRVLYIDIDVHHGDGVERAFLSSDRVLTLSLHKYDPAEFFPGTGGPLASGPENPRNPGARHSLNVPLRDGIDDAQYAWVFDRVVAEAAAVFRPGAVVLQCGADSLGGDRLGKFNLNIRAHGHCVETCRGFGLPLLVLGGGGYTARNVARLWCHETALATDVRLADEIPGHVPFRQAFTGKENGDGRLYCRLDDVGGKRHVNEHDDRYLREQVRRCTEQLRYLRGAPSVEMRRVPRDAWGLREEIEEGMREDEVDRDGGDGVVLGEDAGRVRRRVERNVGGRGEML